VSLGGGEKYHCTTITIRGGRKRVVAQDAELGTGQNKVFVRKKKKKGSKEFLHGAGKKTPSYRVERGLRGLPLYGLVAFISQ